MKKKPTMAAMRAWLASMNQQGTTLFAIWVCEVCQSREVKVPWPGAVPKEPCQCGADAWRKDREVKEHNG